MVMKGLEEMEKAIDNVLNIVAQVDALREDTLEKLKNGINVNTELISALGRLMNTVADILPGKIDSLEWKKLYEDMQINQLPADFCDCLEEWENEVYKWCEFQKESFRICNMCGHKVQYMVNPGHFKVQQKKHGFPWWNAVFESISMVNRTCPECQSMDRERMIALFLDMLKPEGNERLKVLQIAPSDAMDHWLREKEYIDYETTDLYLNN